MPGSEQVIFRGVFSQLNIPLKMTLILQSYHVHDRPEADSVLRLQGHEAALLREFSVYF
jgi:hypothetical protein